MLGSWRRINFAKDLLLFVSNEKQPAAAGLSPRRPLSMTDAFLISLRVASRSPLATGDWRNHGNRSLET